MIFDILVTCLLNNQYLCRKMKSHSDQSHILISLSEAFRIKLNLLPEMNQ